MKLNVQDVIGLIGIAVAMIATLPLSAALLTNNGPMGLTSMAMIVIGVWVGCREVSR